MAKQRNLLIEIGTEELPPKALSALSTAFTDGIITGLKNANLEFGAVKSFATPRRLAILVYELDEVQPDQKIERKGPAVTAAFDEEGVPTKAATGFAKSVGLSVDELETQDTKKGTWLVARTTTKGQQTTNLISDILQQSLDKLPTPKRMRWGSGDAQFVRPVHRIIILFGKEVVETEIFGIKSGKQTFGHRFHAPKNLNISKPDDYENILLKKGRVIASFEERKQQIQNQLSDIVKQHSITAVVDDNLLDEVTSMVEWPVAVMGEFEQKFLDIPSEALISTMKSNQKYFHTVDENNQLTQYFITIANIASKDTKKVQQGNERVIRPRLADANFFWKLDQKTTLSSNLEKLKTVVFQKQLGSIYDKVQRVTQLAGCISEQLSAAKIDNNKADVETAASLCKCDLMTEMVMEFTDLQGVMGRYYAKLENHNDDICTALDEYYKPRFAGDELPQSITAQILAVADKIDTLVGVFAIGQKPTGDKDPFALRRATIGSLRILIECDLPLDVNEILLASAKTFAADLKAENNVTELHQFMIDRLRTYYSDLNIDFSVFDSVVSQYYQNPSDIHARIKAVDYFKQRPEASSLSAANKRISNILKKVDGQLPVDIDPKKFTNEAENTLFSHLEIVQKDIQPLMEKLDYTAILQELSVLKEPVDGFFDNVMVLDDDLDVRNNRLAILNLIHKLFLNVADISKLQAS
ncbi:Glycyl-tRNA synthetase beta chain [hydrothermal vent metagenome]|uniref:glycine--tRNA ligase n=1 Tax=hydrothermal vent metagenome TaxID=652676 RepID=A0A3B1APR6_9ZZZZ